MGAAQGWLDPAHIARVEAVRRQNSAQREKIGYNGNVARSAKTQLFAYAQSRQRQSMGRESW